MTGCGSAGADMFDARLVGGQADPGGAWAYGRLQVFTGRFFSSLAEQTISNNNQELGVRGVAVACRSLGFATGAQLVSGISSRAPGKMAQSIQWKSSDAWAMRPR